MQYKPKNEFAETIDICLQSKRINISQRIEVEGQTKKVVKILALEKVNLCLREILFIVCSSDFCLFDPYDIVYN